MISWATSRTGLSLSTMRSANPVPTESATHFRAVFEVVTASCGRVGGETLLDHRDGHGQLHGPHRRPHRLLDASQVLSSLQRQRQHEVIDTDGSVVGHDGDEVAQEEGPIVVITGR